MQTLSIRQPWAWLIVQGYKDIENRAWPTPVRGAVLIHASKRLTNDAFSAGQYAIETIPGIRQRIDAAGGMTLGALRAQCGGIVGQAEILDCVTVHPSPWFTGRYGFVLGNAQPLAFLPWKGRLGFFEVPYLRVGNGAMVC